MHGIVVAVQFDAINAPSFHTNLFGTENYFGDPIFILRSKIILKGEMTSTSMEDGMPRWVSQSINSKARMTEV